MKKRSIVFLVAGVGLLSGIWLARGSLSHRALGQVLENPAPTDGAMKAFVSSSPEEAAALAQLWDSGKIPQREFALNYLIRHAHDDAALWQAATPWVLSATDVADSEMQAVALELFTDHKNPHAQSVALRYLASADPDARVTGLMRLNDLRDKAYAAEFARMLDDPDAKVQIIAAAALHNVTGADFGMHLTAGTRANESGLMKWKAWWQEHAGEYAAAAPSPATDTSAATANLSAGSPGAAFAFSLPTLDGKHVSLADFRGKVVLVNFWATWCPSCVSEMPALGELQRAHPDDLVILGINLDGVVDSDDKEEPLDDKTLAAMRVEIQKAVNDAKVGYPTLLDPHGSTLGPYGAGSLPESVLIGADGTVRRRVVGMRTNAAWEGMIAEARR